MSNELLGTLITIGITAVIFTGDFIVDVIKNKIAKKKAQKNEKTEK